nr:hypothetical protein [Tanacetum cinerariifolium]
MKKVSTGFSGIVTTLFDNILVPAANEVGLIQDDVQSITIPTEPFTSKPHKKHKTKKQQTQAPKDSMKLTKLMDLCTHLSNKVLELESEVIDIKSTYKDRIEKIKGRVDKLEEKNRVLKDLHSLHSKVDTAAPVVEKEKSFKQGRIIAYLDEDIEINMDEAHAKTYKMDLEHQEKVFSMQDIDDEEPAKVEEVLELVKASLLLAPLLAYPCVLDMIVAKQVLDMINDEPLEDG